MDNPFYIIPTLSRTAHITNLYVQKKKKIYKSKIPVKLLTKRGYPLKIDVINLLGHPLISLFIRVFHIIGNRFNICTYDNLYTSIT